MRLIAVCCFILCFSWIATAAPSLGVPPIAWEVDWYDNKENIPLRLWLYTDETRLMDEAYLGEAYFSPARSRLSYIKDTTLHILDTASGQPISHVENTILPPWDSDSPIIMFDTRWLTEDLILTNTMNDYRESSGTSWWNTNRYDVFSYEVDSELLTPLYSAEDGGWIFPHPDGNFIALVNPTKITILNASTLQPLYDPLIIEVGIFSAAIGDGQWYPTVQWAGTSFVFQIRAVGGFKPAAMCFLNAAKGELECKLNLMLSGRYLWNNTLDQVAHVEHMGAGQSRMSIRPVNKDEFGEPLVQQNFKNTVEPVIWLEDGSLLISEVAEFCSENWTTTRHFYVLDQEGDLSPWLDEERTMLDMQVLGDDQYVIAFGDCTQISIELYQDGALTQLAEINENSWLAHFRFIRS